MEGHRFDSLAKALATGMTRRQAVRGVVAGLVAAFSGVRVHDVAAQCDPTPCPDGQQRDPVTCHCFDASCGGSSCRGDREICCARVETRTVTGCCWEGEFCCPGVTLDGRPRIACCAPGYECAGAGKCVQMQCTDPADCPEGSECCRGLCNLFSKPCSPPKQRDSATCGCTCPPITCPSAQVLNAKTCQCECKNPPRDCPDPTVFNSTTCACEPCVEGTEFCAASQACEPACPAGQLRDQATCDCACPVGQEPCGPAGSESCVPNCDPETGEVLDASTCTCGCPEGSKQCGGSCVSCPAGQSPDSDNNCACSSPCPDDGTCPIGQSPDPDNDCQCICGSKGTYCREGDRGSGSPAGCEQCPGDMVPIADQYCACTCPPDSSQTGFCTIDYGCCRADQVCVDTQCVCVDGAQECGGLCVSCPAGQSPDPDNSCACSSPCPTGTTLCNDACINLLIDRQNCGACGNTCGFNETCENGVCVCPGGLHPTAGTPCVTGGQPSCCSGFCDQGFCSQCLGNPLYYSCGELCCTEASCGGSCMAPCQIPGNSPDSC
jgi:hypothetical protein